MKKNDHNTQKKEEDSLNEIERDLTVAVEDAERIDRPVSVERRNLFANRFYVFTEDHKKRHDAFNSSNSDTIDELEESKSKKMHIHKHVILWNLFAFFLLWADVEIYSTEQSVSLFGLSISGINYPEVIIGFMLILLILHIRLTWLIIRENFISSIYHSRYYKNLKTTRIQCREILNLLNRSKRTKSIPIKPAIFPLKTDPQFDFLRKRFVERKTSIIDIELIIFTIASALFTLISFALALLYLKPQFGLPIFFFLLALLFILWFEFFPKPLSKLIRLITNEPV